MTPKEKANHLFDRYNNCNRATGSFLTHFQVKQCALIAVDEIKATYKKSDEEVTYWQQVKTEIENL